MDPDQLASLVNRRSQLIMIHTVFNARCELVITYQNMKYRIVLSFVLVQGQVKRNFQLFLNEMGPSRARYFHSPAPYLFSGSFYKFSFQQNDKIG